MSEARATTKPAARLDQMIAQAAFLVSAFLFLWAFAIFVMQCLGWLQSGQWQPVPVGLLFVSEDGHRWVSYFEIRAQPLKIVPAFGALREVGDVAANMAGRMVGLQKVLGWLLDINLSICLFLFGSVASHIAMDADSKARQALLGFEK